MYTLIPYPKKVQLTEERITLPGTYYAHPGAADPADTLLCFARRTHGICLAIAENEAAAGVVFVNDDEMKTEAYRISVTRERVGIFAADEIGLQNGVSALIQLMRPEGENAFTLPLGEIADEPDSSWRGVMVDLARDWHPFEFLLEYVDMCRFYRLRCLHLHFTDDQSYTLPSRAFPRLSTEGRCYTEEQLRTLRSYASRRGIELVPEIDVPGHSTSFGKGYGDVFGANGIISQTEASLVCMEALFRELCGMFPESRYIHIGGDEAAILKWTEDPESLQACRNRGIDTEAILAEENGQKKLAERMLAEFVRRMANAVLSCKKTPVIWEGFAEEFNDLIPKQSLVMSWENLYQPTPNLQKGGFRLLNCSWSPLYVVTPKLHWSPEQVYNWDVYSWYPIHSRSPYKENGYHSAPTEQIEGGQLLAWGDHIVSEYENVTEGVREEQRLVEQRVPSLSENVWNREKISDFAEFENRMQKVAALYESFRAGK